MTFAEYRELLRADGYRVYGQADARMLVNLFLGNPGFKYCFWRRTCAFLASSAAGRLLLPLAERALIRNTYRFGIDIPWRTKAGPGLYIGHFGGIVVGEGVVIGRNCNISHGVTIGQTNRGPRKGSPTIGDGVYIGAGAKVIGGILVGNDVAIGANTVVTRDVPDHAVVVGMPGRVVSLEGAAGYVNRTDYGCVAGTGQKDDSKGQTGRKT